MLSKKQDSGIKINWPLLAGFMTIIGLLNFSYIATNEFIEGREIPYIHFLYEMTGVYTTMVLFPPLFWFFEKFPFHRSKWIRLFLLHMFASIVFGVSHTFLMWISREAIFQLLDYGHYVYGHMGYRILMEYSKQLITYWFIFSIYFLIGYYKENQERKIKTVQLEQQLIQSRLQALQMQLNPHFLFNTLNMISSIMYENVKIADKMIANLSDLLRYSLNNNSINQDTMDDEVKKLKLYIEIMKARFQDKLVVQFDIDAETLPALVPHFILQPLVENSITHSINNNEKLSIIRISAKKEMQNLKITVEDNGPGIPENFDLTTTEGIGLSNTIERLEKLYGQNQSFKIYNLDNSGVCAELLVPLITKE